MRLKRSRGVVTLVLALVVGATVFAQRPGYRPDPSSYSGNVRYDGRFVFVRMSFSDRGFRGGARWAHDYPRGEENFLKIFDELTAVPAHVTETSVMSWSDPELFKFPVVYMVEPGYWSMSDQDVKGFRAYLLKGGFLILDDFRDQDFANLDLQVSRAFPEGRWVELDATSPVFHSFYEIDSLDVIPQAYDAGRPRFRGMFEDNDPTKRLMIVAAGNTDLSEFWEWSDTGYAPLEVSNQAYKVGINLFMYGLTH